MSIKKGKEKEVRKLFVIALILLFVSSVAFGDVFNPTLLKFSAPKMIHYDFDGTALDINVVQTGTSATGLFLIYTKGKASSIVDITNGNLGWHYMNLIDTCVYVSETLEWGAGTNVVTWGGTNIDGNPVDSDEYTYYIWGYDYANPKQPVAKYFGYAWNERNMFITKDESGNSLTYPLFYRNAGNIDNDVLTTYRYTKWTIGADPNDTNLVADTFVDQYSSSTSYALDPDDHLIIYAHTFNHANECYVEKLLWVPGDKATTQTDWGEGGRYTYSTTATWTGAWMVGAVDIGYGQLICGNVDMGGGENLYSDIIYIDRQTGDEIRIMDVTKIFTVVYPNAPGTDVNTPCTEGPYDVSLQNGRLFMGSFFGWPVGTVNPYAETQDEYVLWYNTVGDGQHDKALDAQGNNIYAWQYDYQTRQDENWFGTPTAYDLGAVSFDLFGPDGRGLGYWNFAGETAGWRFGLDYIDYGSAYDGMYCDNVSTSTDPGDSWFTQGMHFVAHDSIEGTITPEVGVEEEAPSAYTVTQNSPNPFNPTTTIGFSLAEAGNTTVNVYNIAGQKVDTIVNEFMDAGSHSVVWDASDFSAGVYFYTVKSGDFSKTTKMTLIR